MLILTRNIKSERNFIVLFKQRGNMAVHYFSALQEGIHSFQAVN